METLRGPSVMDTGTAQSKPQNTSKPIAPRILCLAMGAYCFRHYDRVKLAKVLLLLTNHIRKREIYLELQIIVYTAPMFCNSAAGD